MQACYYHSSKEAEYICKSCKKEICKACIILVEGEPFCQMCWEGYIADVKYREQAEEESALGIPWAEWRDLGILNAFIYTLSQVAFQPSRFFEKIPPKSGFSSPFLFAFLCVVLFWFPMNMAYFNALTSIGQNTDIAGAAREVPAEVGTYLKQFENYTHLGLLAQYLFSYIIVASLIQHGIIFLLKGKKGYDATFQIRCYAMAAQFLQIIPLFGILLAEVLSIIVCARGFHVVQQLSWPKAVLVSAFPLIFALLILTITF